MSEPLPLRWLNHIALTTKRPEESRRFYCEVLGFREVPRPNFDYPGAWLVNYGITIHLIYSDFAPNPDGDLKRRQDHFALHTDDLEGAVRLLEEHGIPYRRSEIADTGVKQVFFRDPDGHYLEIGTYPAEFTFT